jgi:flagellar hook-basal body complex protein FliE
MSGVNPINSIAGDFAASVREIQQRNPAAEESTAASPGAVVGDFMDAVNQLQSQAGALQQSLYSDQPTELHRVMIAAQEAGTAMELLVEIRNHLVEAYQELMRMPV